MRWFLSPIIIIGALLSQIVTSHENPGEYDKYSDKDLQQVIHHYTNYPYPPYNPQKDTSGGNVVLTIGQLNSLNHYFYRGRGDLGRTRRFRILIAGGGTGNSLLHFSLAFKGRNVSIVYLDFSEKSLEIAKYRAENAGYKNISFVHSSIYNIPDLDLGVFDLIDCYGVLHHLPDPQEGLRVLRESLAVDGGMSLMLYAYYGRQGVYSMQGSQKILSANRSLSLQEEVNRGRVLFNNHHIYTRALYYGLFPEAYTDVGLYDLYLHKKDKAFTIPELYDYIEDKGGLRIISHRNDHFREFLDECPPHLKSLDLRKRHAVNEMIFGHESKHEIYVTRSNETEASVDELDNVPYFIVDNVNHLIDVSFYKKNAVLSVLTSQKHLFPRRIRIPVSKYTNLFLKLIARDSFTIGELINFTVKTLKAKNKQFGNVAKDLKRTLRALILHGMVFLRHKSIPHFPREMQQTKIEEVQLKVM